MAGSFKEKLLRVTFALTSGAKFGSSGSTLTLQGLRTVAYIQGAGLPAYPSCELAIYGMKQDDMNALSSLADNYDSVSRNIITVDANGGQGWSTVFYGQIAAAFADYSGMPEVCMRIQGRALYFESINQAPVISYPGAADVNEILSKLGVAAGYKVINNGVNHQLVRPYKAGTVGDQIRAICSDAGIDMFIDGLNMTISPKGKATQDSPYTLTPLNGLISYPVATSSGNLQVRALYNPAFKFGGPITIDKCDVVIDVTPGKTSIVNTRANGKWQIGVMAHTLEAVKPGGAWYTDMVLTPIGAGVITK